MGIPFRSPTRRGSVSAFVTVCGVAALLAGCAGERSASGTLSAEEIRQTVVRNPLTRCSSILLGAWRYTARHVRDGRMSAVVLAGQTREDATGAWRVTSDDLYCRTWDNDWAGGREGCFRVSRADDTLVFDHVSGAAGESQRYTYRLGEACD
ncbi:MAG: hypothetical protein RLO01_14000 [Thalassobaculaceae bacterium]